MEKQEQKYFDEKVEKAVLGVILQRNDVFVNISLSIKSDAFYIEKNKNIYQAMEECFNESKNIDEITLANILERKKQFQDCGGYLYLSELLESAPAPESVKHYTDILMEKYLSRGILKLSVEMANKVQSNQEALSVLADTQKKFDELLSEQQNTFYYSIADILPKVEKDIQKLQEKQEEYTGLRTGFRFLNNITSGLQNTDLIVVAARPSVGKTAFALDIAYNVAAKEDKGVAFFSLEMSKEQIAMRILSSLSEIDSNKIRTAKFSEKEWSRFSNQLKEISQTPFYICDEPAINSFQVQALSRRIQHDLKGNLGLIVVDYLQLMRSTGKYNNRQEEIAEISRNLKQIAKDLNVPVIANAQLNRDLEKRKDKRPILSDLRDSGTIEQDADIVMFIYRDILYNEDTNYPHIAEILVSKFRNGETGKHRLYFKGEYTRFYNLSSEQERQFEITDMSAGSSPI